MKITPQISVMNLQTSLLKRAAFREIPIIYVSRKNRHSVEINLNLDSHLPKN